MGTCAECEEKEKKAKTRNQETQGGCVRCKFRFKRYDQEPCKSCNLDSCVEDYFPGFEASK